MDELTTTIEFEKWMRDSEDYYIRLDKCELCGLVHEVVHFVLTFTNQSLPYEGLCTQFNRPLFRPLEDVPEVAWLI